MSMKTKAIVAAGLALVCIVGVIAMFTTRGSLREHIADTYIAVPASSVAGATERSRTYRSSAGVGATASAIADKWKPAERLDQPGGTFLRYRDDMVSVTPDGTDAAFVTIDNARDGYTRWFPYIGGFWGTAGGSGGSFRGGGPGGGGK